MPRQEKKSLSPDSPTTSQPIRSRMLRLFLAALFGLAIVLLFLPSILVNTSLKQRAIDWAMADIHGKVKLESVSAGWLSPLIVQNATLEDQEGQVVVRVESLHTSQSLLGFLTGGDLGSIKVVAPQIDLITRPDGSNLEDIFAEYIAPTNESESEPIHELPAIQVDIENGIVNLSTPSIRGTQRIENLMAQIKCSQSEAPFSVQLQCNTIAPGDESSGEVTAAVMLDPGQAEISGNQLQSEIKTVDFSISVLAPVLNRLIGPTNCAGRINCDMTVAADMLMMSAKTDIHSFHATNVAVIATEYLGKDQFSAANLTAAGAIQLSSKGVSATGFQMESEFARMKADGDFDFGQLSELASGNAVPQSGFQLDGLVDLAQVTAMLPQTTHLQEGAKLNSGLLQVQASTRNENGVPRMIANVDAANVVMMVDGQVVSWQQPMRLAMVAKANQKSLMLENVQLESDFLNASGSANLEQGQLNIAGDLKKMTDQLNQIFDLGEMQLSGRIAGDLAWKTDQPVQAAQNSADSIPIDLQGQFRIEQPDIRIPGFEPWQEDLFDVSVVSKLNPSASGAIAVNSGRFEVGIGNEKATAVLQQPIGDLSSENKFQFQCELVGSLAKWLDQARHFVAMPEFFADGNLNSQFILTLNSKSCRVNKMNFRARDLVFNGFGMDVREPEAIGKVNLKYDLASGVMEFAKSSIKSNSFAANTKQMTLLANDNIRLDGVLGFRARVNQASNWFGMSLPGDSVRWDGVATGTMTFSSESNTFGGQLDSRIQDLVVVQMADSQANGRNTRVVSNQNRFDEVWREPEITIKSRIDLTDDFNRVQLTELTFHSKLADLVGNGTVSDLAGQMVTKLVGQWHPHWESINHTLRELAGDYARFQGQGWQPFQIQGPLFEPTTTTPYRGYLPPNLIVTTGASWTELDVMDMQLGLSKVGVAVNQSVAQLSSSTRNGLADQVLQLKPMLDLRTENPMVVMGQGKLLDRWHLTAADSRSWIKYAAPLIADATSTEGEASITLEGASMFRCSIR